MRHFALLLGIALSLISNSAAAQNCDGFTDVLASSPFCPDVTWITTYGITKGCAPSQFCPNENVTRLQMAVFMHRQGENPGFVNGGNAFGAAAVLGTNDNNSIVVLVDGRQAMSIQPAVDSIFGFNPNIVSGSNANTVFSGFAGETIAGGGGCNLGTGGTCTSGGGNQVTGEFGTVGGGLGNSAGELCTVAGGSGNTASQNSSTVGGGNGNSANGANVTVAGGLFNSASGFASAVPGGFSNNASGNYSFAGGNGNTASGEYATVAGGQGNTAGGYLGMVPGGDQNVASGTNSFAAGHRAMASTDGSFIWADTQDFDFGPSVDNFFGVRATGGVGFTIAIDDTGKVTQYCNLLPPIPSWSCTSDRDAKENFISSDGKDILRRLVAMPLFSWNFKGADPTIRLLGPTAQDFFAAFGLGRNDKSIANVNLEGVALAAVQGLNAKVDEQTTLLQSRLENAMQEKDRQLYEQTARIHEQQREIAELRERVQKAETLAADVAALRAALVELQRGRATVAVR